MNITEYVTPAVKARVSLKAALFVFFTQDLDNDNVLDESEVESEFNKTDKDGKTWPPFNVVYNFYFLLLLL